MGWVLVALASAALRNTCPWGWTETHEDVDGVGEAVRAERTIDDCAAACAAVYGCEAFEYERSTQTCHTFTSRSVGLGEQATGWTACLRMEFEPLVARNRTHRSPVQPKPLVCTIRFSKEPGDALHSTTLPYSFTPGTLSALDTPQDHVLLVLDGSDGDGDWGGGGDDDGVDREGRLGRLEQALSLAHLEDGQLHDCNELHLSGGNLSSASAYLLAAALSRGAMPGLARLELDGNAIGSEGLLALLAAIRAGGAERLWRINLSANRIGENGVLAITLLVREGGLRALREIDLRHNAVDAAVDELRHEAAASRPGWLHVL